MISARALARPLAEMAVMALLLLLLLLLGAGAAAGQGPRSGSNGAGWGGYGGLAHSKLPHVRDEAVRYQPAPPSAAAPHSRPQYGCQHPPQNSMGFCNPKLSTEARIRDLLGRLHMDEKLNLLSTGNKNISRLGLGSCESPLTYPRATCPGGWQLGRQRAAHRQRTA